MRVSRRAGDGRAKRIVRYAIEAGRKEGNMPIYEYECRQCKRTFTEKHTFQEHDQHKKVKCPKCGSTRVQQVISPTFAKTSKKS